MYGNASLVIHWNERLEELTIETKIIELNYNSIPQALTKEVYVRSLEKQETIEKKIIFK